MDTRMKLQEERQNLERQLRENRRKLDELLKLTPKQQLATELHDLLCHANHTVGYSWGYESWDDVEKTHAKKYYYSMASRVLGQVDFDTAMVMLEAMRYR